VRYDYFVVDEYGDVWNEEPLPTLSAASQFRGYIRPIIVGRHELKLKSVPRQGYFEPQVVVKEHAESDF
jgi:hypothetical protein